MNDRELARRRTAQERLPKTFDALESGRAEGLHLGAQLYVSRRGETVADCAVGERRPGEALRSDDLLLWLSSSKPLTAVAIAQLWERELLGLDDPIARHLPEFAAGGKEGITLRHALTHTGGFRMLGIGWPETPWPEIIAKIAAGRREPRWEPGRQAGYHMASSWFILGEVVQRLSGRPVATYLREEVLEPVGATDSWVGMPLERHRAYADADRLATMYDTSGEAPKELGWKSAERSTNPSPAGGGRGPIRDLGHFYEALLAGGQGTGGRILRPQTVEALVARHRVGLLDKTFKHVMDWGLGFIPDSKQYGETVPYAYGPHCSSRTWGHSGHRSSTGFADGEHGLAVALGFNGLPSDAEHHRRIHGVLAALYDDLNLA